jgi:Ca2+-dependent lipid-binding protein
MIICVYTSVYMNISEAEKREIIDMRNTPQLYNEMIRKTIFLMYILKELHGQIYERTFMYMFICVLEFM